MIFFVSSPCFLSFSISVSASSYLSPHLTPPLPLLKLSEATERLHSESKAVTDVHAKDTTWLNNEKATENARAKQVRDEHKAALAAFTAGKLALKLTAISAREVQQAVKVAAEKDTSEKTATHVQDLKNQAASLIAEQSKKDASYEVAKEENENDLKMYADEEKLATDLITKERAILSEIVKILAGDHSASAAAAVNACASEKGASSAARDAAHASALACTQAKVAANAAGSTPAACTGAKADAAAATAAAATFNTCLATKASSALIEARSAAVAQLKTMARKYVDATAVNKVTDSSKSAASGLVAQLDAALVTEQSGVAAAATKDREGSAARRAAAEGAADKVYTDEKVRREGIVANSKKIKEDAEAVQATETASWDDLSTKEAGAVGVWNAAVEKERVDGIAAEELKSQEDAAALHRHTTQTTKIDAIKESDLKYITNELDDIEELLEIVAKLNLVGAGRPAALVEEGKPNWKLLSPRRQRQLRRRQRNNARLRRRQRRARAINARKANRKGQKDQKAAKKSASKTKKGTNKGKEAAKKSRKAAWMVAKRAAYKVKQAADKSFRIVKKAAEQSFVEAGAEAGAVGSNTSDNVTEEATKEAKKAAKEAKKAAKEGKAAKEARKAAKEAKKAAKEAKKDAEATTGESGPGGAIDAAGFSF